MLFTSERYDGAVILTRRMKTSRVVGHGLRAEAGASLPSLIKQAEAAGLGGLERFAGIPGTVGGAVFGNAGGPPGSATVGDRVRRVRVLEPGGEVVWRSREDLGLRYRASDLQGCLVLSVDLELTPDRVERLREVRREITLRKARVQPLGAWSAGCTFRNPEGDSAGRLIDRLGLKGLRAGDAEVSTHHGNFIVNRGAASPAEILSLMDEVRDRVFRAHGITLQPELRLVA
jgi:UDP-N-acetylmuramate dehydrogenase